MNNSFLIAEKVGTDLSSRFSAIHARNEVLSQIRDSNGWVLLDFSNVRSISNSFADEFLAVLVEQYGRSWFKQCIKLANLKEQIRNTILESIASREGFTGTT